MFTKKIVIALVVIFLIPIVYFSTRQTEILSNIKTSDEEKIQIVAEKNVPKDFVDLLESDHIAKAYNKDQAYNNFIDFAKNYTDDPSLILKEMSVTARTQQRYISDAFKNQEQLKITRYGNDYIVTATNKQYLKNNNFYVINFVTKIPIKDAAAAIKYINHSQDVFFNWRNVTENYNQDKFIKVLKLASDQTNYEAPIYSSVLHLNKKNIAAYYEINVKKVKDAGIFPIADDNGNYYIRIAGKHPNAEKIALRQKGFYLASKMSVITTEEELKEVVKYVEKNKTSIKYPFIAKIDCLTRLEEQPPFQLLYGSDVAKNKIIKKTKKEIYDIINGVNQPDLNPID